MGKETKALAIPDVKAIDQVVQECRLAATANHMERALTLAQGIDMLDAMLTPEHVEAFSRLQGKQIGFLTDRDRDGGYPPPVVKSVIVEALIRGLYITGNEFNIIAGKCYVTRWGFERLVRDFPGVADLELHPGPPNINPNPSSVTAYVPYRVTWVQDGEPRELVRAKTDDGDSRIVVKVDTNREGKITTSADAMIGKATRRVLAAVYAMVASDHAILPVAEGEVNGEIEEEPAEGELNERESRAQGLVAKLGDDGENGEELAA